MAIGVQFPAAPRYFATCPPQLRFLALAGGSKIYWGGVTKDSLLFKKKKISHAEVFLFIHYYQKYIG